MMAVALVGLLAAGLVLPPVARVGSCAHPATAVCQPLQMLRMQEAEPATVAALDDDASERMADFTEDLLDALAADDAPLGEEGDDEDLLRPKRRGISEPNAAHVAELRAKYKLHEGDTGSSQVQIAVLTARINYMTKHMQANKKDYGSLRGLTAMVTKRRKLLQFLLKEDLPEFKRITQELGIRTNQLLKPKLPGARGRRV